MKNCKNIKPLGRGILLSVGTLFFAAILALLWGWFLMLLWNWLMPEIFGLPNISYWQGWGLNLLSHLIFNSGKNLGSGPENSPFFRVLNSKADFKASHSHEIAEFDEFKKEFNYGMRASKHELERKGKKEDFKTPDVSQVEEDRD